MSYLIYYITKHSYVYICRKSIDRQIDRQPIKQKREREEKIGKQQIQYILPYNEIHAKEREKDKQTNRQIDKQTNRKTEKEYTIHIKNKQRHVKYTQYTIK